MSQTDRPHEAHAALDRAIEHALRQIVQVDPPDRLAERVLARIASNERPTPMRFYAAVGVGLAAAAAIVLAVVLRSPADHVRTDRAATTSAPAATNPGVGTSPAASGQTALANTAAAPEPSPARRVPRTASVQTTQVIAPLEPAIGVAKLDAPTPIAIPAIAPEQAEAPESLEIPRLEIAPIDMTGRSERNR